MATAVEWSECSWVIRIASTRSGRARPRASNRRKSSLRPSPASMRRVVCSVSSNVQLPVLPEARMETRNEMRSSERDHCREEAWRQRENEELRQGRTESGVPRSEIEDGHPKHSRLERELCPRQFESVEVAYDAGGDSVGVEEIAGELLDFAGGDGFE